MKPNTAFWSRLWQIIAAAITAATTTSCMGLGPLL